MLFLLKTLNLLENILHKLVSMFLEANKFIILQLIICYISNIAEFSSGFHQADWSTTLGIVYCYPISFLFWFICLHVYRNLILTISAQMKTSAQFKFALYVTND